MTDRKVRIDENEKEVRIVDPEDYARTQKLKDIYRTKREYQKKVRENNPATENITQSFRLFLNELYPLMKRKETERDYLNEPLATVESFSPSVAPDSVTELNVSVSVSNGWTKKDPDREEVREELREIGALTDMKVDLEYLSAGDAYWNWSLSQFDRKVITKEAQLVSLSTVSSGYSLCIEFMAEVGLALEIEQETGPAQI